MDLGGIIIIRIYIGILLERLINLNYSDAHIRISNRPDTLAQFGTCKALECIVLFLIFPLRNNIRAYQQKALVSTQLTHTAQ